MLIYIIEDNPDWQSLYRSILSQHTLRTFPDGVSAIEAIDKNLPDAIILDMLLVGPAAPALLAELQSYPDTAKIPIALITGVDVPSDMSDYGITVIFDKAKVTPQEIQSWISKQEP